MQALVVVLILLGVFALLDTRQSDESEFEKNRAIAIAGQMAYYHTLAAKACSVPSTCQNGPVDVNVATGATNFGYKGKITSVFDSGSGMVVTTWQPSPALNDPQKYYGLISAALRQSDPGSLHAGAYNLATQSVTAQAYRMFGHQTTVSAPSTLPSDVGGITLENLEPVIATKVR